MAEIKYTYHKNGNVDSEMHVSDSSPIGDTHHREDGPALTTHYPDGTIEREHWIQNDNHHRLDGPAVTSYFDDGTIETESWWIDGLKHRVDGPAEVVYNPDGTVQHIKWIIDGRLVKSPFDNYPLTMAQKMEVKLIHG